MSFTGAFWLYDFWPGNNFLKSGSVLQNPTTTERKVSQRPASVHDLKITFASNLTLWPHRTRDFHEIEAK